jgi:two-component system cell cycle response regulator
MRPVAFEVCRTYNGAEPEGHRIVSDEYRQPPEILVIDDDWMIRDLLQAHLEAAGFHVMTANSGDKALEIIKVQIPDLVLLDVRMPGIDGYEVCARLKSHQATRRVPVVIVTALDNDEDYLKAVEVGADDFLPKPFNSVVMVARIRSLLRIKNLYDALDHRRERLRTVLGHHLDADTADQILADLER